MIKIKISKFFIKVFSFKTLVSNIFSCTDHKFKTINQKKKTLRLSTKNIDQ